MLKSLFISGYILALHLILGLSCYQLYDAGFNWIGFGLLVSSLPGAFFFDILMITKALARTDRNLSPITLIIFIGFGFVLFGNYLENIMDPRSIALGSISSMGWLIYLYWYSNFGTRENSVLKVGNKLPNLTLVDHSQTNFQTNSLLGAPSLFLFYRGNWCPLCMAQIKEIAGEYKQLAEKGVQIVLVSPQPQSKTRKLARQLDLPFIFLQDSDSSAAKYLGICAENGLPFGMQILGYDSDVPMPTLIITDRNGNIVFADLTDNYRIRPEPSHFLSLFDQLRT